MNKDLFKDYKNRTDLAKAVKECRDNHIKFKITKSVVEGYRYKLKEDKENEQKFMNLSSEWNVLNVVNNLLTSEYSLLESAKSAILTLTSIPDSNEELISLLNIVADDATINIGILHKALSLVSPDIESKINIGTESADAVVNNEVVKTDFEQDDTITSDDISSEVADRFTKNDDVDKVEVKDTIKIDKDFDSEPVKEIEELDTSNIEHLEHFDELDFGDVQWIEDKLAKITASKEFKDEEIEKIAQALINTIVAVDYEPTKEEKVLLAKVDKLK